MSTIFTIFFLKHRHKSLVRVDINMININNILDKIIGLCNLDVWFKYLGKCCEVLLNLFGLVVTMKPVWGCWSAIGCSLLFLEDCHLSLSTLHGVRVKSKIQSCDPIEWWWASIRQIVWSGNLHRVFLQGLAYKDNIHGNLALLGCHTQRYLSIDGVPK